MRGAANRERPTIISAGEQSHFLISGPELEIPSHGNMCSTDVLGMAPNAQIYDIRISDGATIAATISNALAGVNWAINPAESRCPVAALSKSKAALDAPGLLPIFP